MKIFAISWALLGICACAFAEEKPKYGPDATPISVSNEYFREQPAPDYWALSPYYAAQQNERSCSVASVAMVVNGARAGRKLGSEDELVTQGALLKSVVKRFKDRSWARHVGNLGRGVTLDQLRDLVEKSLKAYGFESPSVEAVHVEVNDASRSALHAALAENESSPKDFIIANFLQGTYTGDADVGHIAPVAAYDAKRKRVLLLDPDRQWYEPYWVAEEVFLKGMATLDKVSGKSRGYLRIRL